VDRWLAAEAAMEDLVCLWGRGWLGPRNVVLPPRAKQCMCACVCACVVLSSRGSFRAEWRTQGGRGRRTGGDPCGVR